MNKNVLFILIGAVCTAFIVALAVQAILKSDEPVAAAQVSMTQILVATNLIGEGAELSEKNTDWVDWPEDAVFKGVYERSDGQDVSDLDIMGKAVRREIASDEPILKSAVVELSDEGGNFLAATLDEGMLAFSIPVTPASSVGGFARPGDRVDVLMTYRVSIPRELIDRADGKVKRYVTETILEGVRVLAVDQASKEGDREAKIGKVITLEVTPKGAEVLALGAEMGDLSLALRRLGNGYEKSPEEQQAGMTTDVSVGKAMQLISELRRSKTRASAAGAGSYIQEDGGAATIRVFRGANLEFVTVPLAQ